MSPIIAGTIVGIVMAFAMGLVWSATAQPTSAVISVTAGTSTTAVLCGALCLLAAALGRPDTILTAFIFIYVVLSGGALGLILGCCYGLLSGDSGDHGRDIRRFLRFLSDHARLKRGGDGGADPVVETHFEQVETRPQFVGRHRLNRSDGDDRPIRRPRPLGLDYYNLSTHD